MLCASFVYLPNKNLFSFTHSRYNFCNSSGSTIKVPVIHDVNYQNLQILSPSICCEFFKDMILRGKFAVKILFDDNFAARYAIPPKNAVEHLMKIRLT